ncbi:RagB/SusD family nutrient uptake outer membrane protein [Reichenbachiella versicolor]|uniref:RagB/SusD family nutrient uptake outer membrane protein n=1 Tax=Reichenbachiella versicolor TaxID=1821036 RepID=UPI000D6E51B2|nr:RagB/SusD family nutrient uptake outer membrane protein [Reichenbachiella versicolor]
MKKKLLSVIIAIGLCLGCSDEFTTVSPRGSLNDEVLQNEDGVNLLLVGAYGLLDGFITGDPWLSSGDGWWLDVLTDDAHKGSTDTDQGDLQRLQTYIWTSDNPYLFSKWQALYGGIDRCNSVINVAGLVENPDELTTQIAEARFLRAHFHFELQRLWGSVPYIGEEEQADPNLPNEGAIWDKIEADFQFAIDNLPESSPDGEPGRANAWAAKAFLAKVHLQQGEYNEAQEIFSDVINNGPFMLATEFNDNFTGAGKNGTESILAIQFAIDGPPNDANANQGSTLTHPGGGPYGSCCGFYQPSQDLANSFKTDASGLPLLDTYNDSDITNDMGLESYQTDTEGNVIEDGSGNPVPTAYTPYTGNLDPRIDYTIGRRGIDFNGYGLHPGKDWVRAQADGGPYMNKKTAYKKEEEGSTKGAGAWGQQHSGLNYNIMRYADLLLMAAEAEVELNMLAEAEGHVNMVRNRAKNMTYLKEVLADGTVTTNDAATYVIEPYADGTFAAQGQDYARKAVRHERRLELGMEGHRIYDLKRYSDAVNIIEDWKTNEDRLFGDRLSSWGTFQEKNLLFPIPVTAIDLSNGVLNQTEMWK